MSSPPLPHLASSILSFFPSVGVFSFWSFLHFLFVFVYFFLPSPFILPTRSSLTLSSHLVIIIRLQVPRLALRRRLNALSGGVSRPAPWRRRPIAFLCYMLSASTLRPLANRVRAAAGWLLIGQREPGRQGIGRNFMFLYVFSNLPHPRPNLHPSVKHI